MSCVVCAWRNEMKTGWQTGTAAKPKNGWGEKTGAKEERNVLDIKRFFAKSYG